MRKFPYANEVLSDEKIEEAANDIEKIFCHCQSVPPVFMIKSYDTIEERPKVSYTSEMIAKQLLKKVIIGKLFRDNKTKPYLLWELSIDNHLRKSVKALKFYSEDHDVFSYFRGYDYKQLENIKEELAEPFLNHIHDVMSNKDEEIYKHILVLISSILQKLNFKIETALIILGNQGTGKNVFANVICKLFARYANENITSIESMVGNSMQY